MTLRKPAQSVKLLKSCVLHIVRCFCFFNLTLIIPFMCITCFYWISDALISTFAKNGRLIVFPSIHTTIQCVCGVKGAYGARNSPCFYPLGLHGIPIHVQLFR